MKSIFIIIEIFFLLIFLDYNKSTDEARIVGNKYTKKKYKNIFYHIYCHIKGENVAFGQKSAKFSRKRISYL